MAELRKSFRPEFLNRVDETILFKLLTLEEITSIVDLLMAGLHKPLADRQVTACSLIRRQRGGWPKRV